MSSIPASVRPHLRCPRCRGELVDRLGSDGVGEGLGCKACALVYPVRQGRPILIAEEARPDAGPPPR